MVIFILSIGHLEFKCKKTIYNVIHKLFKSKYYFIFLISVPE